MSQKYNSPIDRLLEIGMSDEIKYDWPDYLEMGFTEEHVSELINLARDVDLFIKEEDTPDSWGPVHAWRVLGQLKAEQAIEPLISLLPDYDVDYSDWFLAEFPMVMTDIGKITIPYLKRYLSEENIDSEARITLAETLLKLVDDYPEIRQECIDVFTLNLQNYRRNSYTLNAFLIWFLVDLNAVEAAPLMEQAFNEGMVDIGICGNWDDIQMDLGLIEDTRKDLFPDWGTSGTFGFTQDEMEKISSRLKKSKNKKVKRKMKKASQKKRKKKKKRK